PADATTEDRTSMAWLSVSESTAEARKRPTRRWDASITAVRNRDRHRRTPARAPIVGSESAAQAAALDQRTVALDVDLLQVLEHAAALSEQAQEVTTRVVVLLVVLEVFGEAGDPAGQQRNLNLGRAGVALVSRVFLDDLLLRGSVESHGVLLRIVARRADLMSSHCVTGACENGRAQRIRCAGTRAHRRCPRAAARSDRPYR